ncbi:MAG TPA: LCP family protein [Thermoleophilaceae bacterium]|nr:LCP family protein [Thermoleophilaceae bacterium]
MADPPPEYKVYRSRRNPLAGLRPKGDLEGLRRRLGRRREREPGDRGITPGRVVKWLALAVGGWIVLSLALFLLSSLFQGGVSDEAERALSSQGNLLTGSNILILGSDARTGDSIDESQTGPARADTIMVMHAAFGSVRKLSIPRDAEAQIPGHGTQKINAAYALGGSALTVETVEGYLGNGLRINHVVEVDFEDLPAFIDAFGGVTVNVKNRICSPPFDNFWKGFNLRAGERKLNGRRALGFARVRKNNCAPNENDLDRAERQQELLNAIRRRMLTPGGFLRMPLISWRAPRALKTDMSGPSLLALAADAAAGSSDEPIVLEPSCLDCGIGGSLRVSDGSKSEAVRRLEG